MPWYLYLACKQLFPSGRFPFFTAISVLGVTLGVAVLIIVTSVMGGFGYEIRRMIVETEGEVDVKVTGYLSDPQVVANHADATLEAEFAGRRAAGEDWIVIVEPGNGERAMRRVVGAAAETLSASEHWIIYRVRGK